MLELNLNSHALENLEQLKNDHAKNRTLKDVVKTLNLMHENLRHPSLNTHAYKGLNGPNGEKVFEAYAQQKTSDAYRIFWCYGPKEQAITIIAIVPHPQKKPLH